MTSFPETCPIWIGKRDRTRNRYLVFRREFNLTTVPSRARLKISAYACYQAALNGVILGRGPDPSNHNRYYYDTYDCRRHLQKGRNVISILAYAFGPVLPWPECSYLSGEYGWLVFALLGGPAHGQRLLVGSDSGCRVRPADAWRANAPGYTELRAAYKEYYDAAKFGYDGWLAENVGVRGWRRVVELEPSDLKFTYTFFPKEIPDFRFRDARPAVACCIDGGYAYGFSGKRGWQIENPEALVPNYSVDAYYDIVRQGEPNNNKLRMVTEARNRCVVHKSPGCGVPSLWLDFGGMQYGTFHLDLEASAAGSVIEVGYGESPNITFVDRYSTSAGRQTFSPFHYRAGRYAMLSFKKIRGTITLYGVHFRRCDYPVAFNPEAFVASEATLNRIEEVSANTLSLNMHSHFEDCPWREQKLYLGDMLLEALACYYLWGEYAYVEKNLRQLADRRRADGWITTGPGCSRASCLSKGLIVDFPLYYIYELRDLYLFSGDRRVLEALYPPVNILLENYNRMGVRRGGLVDVGAADSFANWCFINWNDIVKKGQCAALNFMLARGLACAIEMAGWLQRPEDVVRYKQDLQGLRRAIERAFWDPKRGLYRDARFKGKPIDHFSTETNVLAVLSGLPNRTQTRAIVNSLLHGRLEQKTPTPFFTAQVAEVLFRRRQAHAALRLIASYWGGMLQHGADTFWEAYLPRATPSGYPPKGFSLCHGFGGAPAYLLPAYVLGIRPLEPGFRKFAVDPQLAGLASVRGTIPTPHGPITLHIENGQSKLTHPKETQPVQDLNGANHSQSRELNRKNHRAV